MQFYWTKYRVKQVQFIIYRKSGITNLSEYFTKHYLPAHHKIMCSKYLHMDNDML